MKYKATYMACDFTEKDCNGHKNFNRKSFEDYINDPKTQEKIKNKRLLGAISHIWRDKYQQYLEDSNNPSVGDQSDYLLSQNAACNAITDMYIKDNKLFITIETLPTEAGLTLAKLYDAGYDLPVSMSTELDIDNINDEYDIVQVFGLDMTNSPAFNTKIVDKVKENK